MTAAIALENRQRDRAEQLEQLRRQMAAVSGKVGARWRPGHSAADPLPASESLLAVPDALAELFPAGLPKGMVAVLSGARSLPVGMAAAVTGAGGHVAVVGLPDFGLLAAAEMGADLSRLAVIPQPGSDPVEVAAVLMDGMDLVVLGLAGVAVIVRPVTQELGLGQVIALGAAFGFAASVVMVKSLTRTDAAVAVSFWMLVVQCVIGLLPALADWHWPSAATWGWVVVVAFCGTYSHYCFARAMQHADATVVVPMDFLRVPLSALAGWAVYAERIDLLTVLGMVLILGGNLLNLRRPAPPR